MSSLFILGINIVAVMSLANTFPLSVGCSFVLPVVSFGVQTFKFN